MSRHASSHRPTSPPGLLRNHQPWVDPELATLYDAFPFEEDLPLYVQLAEGQGGRVLELASGTGRVLVPLARAGHAVTGVDSSPAMLALARDKIRRAGAEVLARCRLLQGELSSFEVDGPPFDLVVLAVRSFGYLLTRDEQQATLARIAAHLRPGGLFALDLLHPTPAWLDEPPGVLRQDLVEELPEGGAVMRTECTVSNDLVSQVRVIRSIYDEIGDEGRVTRRTVEWPFRWTHRFEAEHLLERAGFEVEAVYGGYEREPLTSDSPTMLFLARLKE